MKLDLNRRVFLQLALLAAACGGDDEGGGGTGGIGGTGGTGGTGPDVPFGVWREIQSALRKSPDHLIAEAERLVAGKDAEAIFALVRDRIATLPSQPEDFGSYVERAWGSRGTLRSGTGTARDKAELLAELFTKAGFPAQVRLASMPADPDWVKKVLLRTVERPFSPAATDAEVSRWLELLGQTKPAPVVQLDADGAQAKALAAEILAKLPATLAVAPFSFDQPFGMPVVAVEVAGQTKLCNVVLPGIAFGDSGTPNQPGNIAEAKALPKLSATLSVVTTAAPKTPVPLVSAELAFEDVIGRSLYVFMVPPEDISQVLPEKLENLRSFIPTLALRGPDMSDAEREAHTYAGSALTRSGDVLVVDYAGKVTFNGTELDTTPADAQKLGSVKSITAAPNATRFAQVSVRVSALDAGGASVQGLPASAFVLEEEGAAPAFNLLENKSPPPRVLFVLDKSTSLPAEFQGVPAATLLKAIATSVLASEPGASFRIHTVGGSPNAGVWSGSAQDVYDAALAQSGLGSDLWLALSEAAGMGSSVIVFITDGDATDTPDDELLAALGEAPPAVFLKVGSFAQATLDQMAKLTGGAVFSVADQSAASTQTLAYVKARQQSSYLLRYDAPAQGPAKRNVKVSLTGGSVSGSGTYDVPPATELVPPVRIGGILLTLKLGDDEVTRVVSGVREILPGTPASLFDQVEHSLIGVTEVRFEGAPPTAAVVLDDLITARLGLEPLWKAAKAGDTPAIYEALLKTPPSHAAACFALHSPLSNPAGGLLFPTGLRAVLFNLAPLDAKRVQKRVDVIPLGAHRAAVAGGREALVAGLEATARIALIEEKLFPTNTRSALAGKPLALLEPFQDISAAVPGIAPALDERWRVAMAGYTNAHRIVPAAGTPVAFWYVEPKTGSLLGVLEDGGGEGIDIQQYEAEANLAIEAIERFAAIASYGGALGTVGGTWLSLELTKAKKLIAATVVIAGGTPSSDPTNWNDFACNAAAGAAGGIFEALAASGNAWLAMLGQLGQAYGSADSVATAATGSSSIC